MSDNEDSIFAQTNSAIWILTSASGGFLLLRLWCRFRFSKLWWDDGLLALSWLILLVACALLSRTITSGYATDDEKRNFFVFQNTSTSMTTIATAWTKVAFAITLLRIIRIRALRCILWAIIVTANMVLILGMISIWIPACTDPRRIFRPAKNVCLDHEKLQYLGGTTMVYGGVIDVVLALFPWFVIRKLLLETREKIGLTIAMSLGAISGAIVIFRTFFQLRKMDNDFHFMVFVAIFNFLEPAVTIIAQAIPMFRVLFISVTKKGTKNGVRLSSPTDALSKALSGGRSAAHKSRSLEDGQESWESKVRSGHPHGHPDLDSDHELLHVRVGPGGRIIESSGPYDVGDDKLYDARNRE
ncbi:hypothetical protein VTI74DRAFT_1552 [Chaetomium olivicolor]